MICSSNQKGGKGQNGISSIQKLLHGLKEEESNQKQQKESHPAKQEEGVALEARGRESFTKQLAEKNNYLKM